MRDVSVASPRKLKLYDGNDPVGGARHRLPFVAVEAGGMGYLGDLDKPNLTEQQLFEYLRDDEELPVTRRSVKYAVMRRDIIPTKIGRNNYFSKRDGLNWIASRKRR